MPLDLTKPDTYGTVDKPADGEFARLDIVGDGDQSWFDLNGDYLAITDMWVEAYIDGEGLTTTLGKESSFARPDWFEYEFTPLAAGEDEESRHKLNLGVIDSVLVAANIHEVAFGHTVSDGVNAVDHVIWVRSSIWEGGEGAETHAAFCLISGDTQIFAFADSVLEVFSTGISSANDFLTPSLNEGFLMTDRADADGELVEVTEGAAGILFSTGAAITAGIFETESGIYLGVDHEFIRLYQRDGTYEPVLSIDDLVGFCVDEAAGVIFYCTRRYTGSANRLRLYIANIDGTGGTFLFESTAAQHSNSLSVSPAGRMVRLDDGTLIYSNNTGTYSYDPSTSTETNIGIGSTNSLVRWGERLAYLKNTDFWSCLPDGSDVQAEASSGGLSPSSFCVFTPS